MRKTELEKKKVERDLPKRDQETRQRMTKAGTLRCLKEGNVLRVSWCRKRKEERELKRDKNKADRESGANKERRKRSRGR